MKKNKTTFRKITRGLFAFALISLCGPAFSQSGEQLSKDSWEVSASVNPNKATKAIDSDANSRWDTGGAQAPGQWFQVDMGAVQPVSTIVINYEKSAGDGPKAYVVSVSKDGKKWDSVAESTTQAPRGKLEISLKKSTKAKFIKIEQKGSSTGTYWSIHEIEAYK